MKNTHITEVLSDRGLNTVSGEDTLKLILNNELRESSSSNYYMLDDRDVLCGVISERQLIRYLGGYIPFVDQSGLNLFFDNLETVRISDIMDKEFKYLSIDSYLTDLLPLIDECCGEIPVVDSKGRLLGEVNPKSILKRFERNQVNRDKFSLQQSC